MEGQSQGDGRKDTREGHGRHRMGTGPAFRCSVPSPFRRGKKLKGNISCPITVQFKSGNTPFDCGRGAQKENEKYSTMLPFIAEHPEMTFDNHQPVIGWQLTIGGGQFTVGGYRGFRTGVCLSTQGGGGGI